VSNTLLRYPGGKSRAAKNISKYFPQHVEKVVSPFIGGGAVEFELALRGIKIYASDIFKPLICFWTQVKYNREKLADAVEHQYLNSMSRDRFYELQKSILNAELSEIELASMFFVLNRCSFSGTTLSGGCSPGFPRFTKSSIDKIRKFDIIDNVLAFDTLDFEEAIALHEDEWLYCDPPYMLKKSNLYGVKGNLHNAFEHDRLHKVLAKRDKWMLSYNDCEEIRELYKNFRINEIKWEYGMNKEKGSKEILIMSENDWR